MLHAVRWATCSYIAQLMSPWKCLANLSNRSGTKSSPHLQHSWMVVRHSMTFRLIPVEVNTRSNAFLRLVEYPITFLPLAHWTTSDSPHAGHFWSMIWTCWLTRSFRFRYRRTLLLFFFGPLPVRM